MMRALIALIFFSIATLGQAAECPWERPYKCRTVSYMRYQCGCGVEWNQNRASGINNSPNPYMTPQPTTAAVTPPYQPPRHIQYGEHSKIYDFARRAR